MDTEHRRALADAVLALDGTIAILEVALAGFNDSATTCNGCGLDRFASFAEHKAADEVRVTLARMQRTRDGFTARLKAAAQERT